MVAVGVGLEVDRARVAHCRAAGIAGPHRAHVWARLSGGERHGHAAVEDGLNGDHATVVQRPAADGEGVAAHRRVGGRCVDHAEGRETDIEEGRLRLDGVLAADDQITAGSYRAVGGNGKREERPEVVEGQRAILPSLEGGEPVLVVQADSIGEVIVLEGDPSAGAGEVAVVEAVVSEDVDWHLSTVGGEQPP